MKVFLGFPDPWRWDREIVPKRSYKITAVRRVITKKSAGRLYIAAEAWIRADCRQIATARADRCSVRVLHRR